MNIDLNAQVIFGDNLSILHSLPSVSLRLVNIDPSFNTGKTQARIQLQTVRSEEGDRVGFKGQRYQSTVVGQKAFADTFFDDFLAFIEPRLRESHRVLAANGKVYFHIDYREVHYCKILLDQIFGRECFLNEIIWAYDYGGRPKNRWPPKHDNILVYVKDPENYIFNYEDIGRIRYIAPGLVGPEKAARGKVPTDVWWYTIVSPTGKEKTGYPTQKPLGILRRIIQASSNPGDLVADFFAGSGSTGAAALEPGRRFLLVDSNPEAIRVMAQRFAGKGVEFIGAEEVLADI
jgi:site-specific DNA-methyltransferase (adenine-specific)